LDVKKCRIKKKQETDPETRQSPAFTMAPVKTIPVVI